MVEIYKKFIDYLPPKTLAIPVYIIGGVLKKKVSYFLNLSSKIKGLDYSSSSSSIASLNDSQSIQLKSIMSI